MEKEKDLIIEEEEEYEEPNKDYTLPSTAKMQILNYDDEDDNLSNSSSSINLFDTKSQTSKSVTASFNTMNYGALPSSQRLEKIFQRMTCQLDFLTRTATMMTHRMDLLQKEINDLKEKNEME